MNLDDAYTEFLTNQVAPPPAPSVPEPAPKQENKQDTSFGDTLLELGRSALDLPDAVIRGSLKGLGEGVYAAGLIDEEQINKFRSMMGAASDLAVTEGVNPIATGLVEDVSQIAPAAIPAFKVLRGFGMARPAAAIIAEGIGGALGYNPDDPNLGNMIQGYIGKDGQGPLSQAMRMLSTNPEDPDIVNRARNFAQDAGIGGTFELAFKAIQKSPAVGRAALDWFNDTARSAQQGTAFSGIPTRVNRELDNPAWDVWNEPLPAEPAPVFYSAVANAVDGLPMDKGNASQMRAMIAKGEGVKPEEMAWIGLDDFLKGKKSVTKQEIKDFVDANQVRIEEVVKAGDYPQRTGDEWQALIMQAERRQDFDEAERLTAEWEAAEGFGGRGSPKFSNYTLPGGENYREVLLRLPEKQAPQVEKYTVQENENGLFDIVNSRGELVEVEATREAAEDAARQFGEGSSIAVPGGSAVNFTGGHFDESNVLAHMRLNDRTGPNGEKILFVEEIQSDWHQKGRKHGYRKEGSEYSDTGIPRVPDAPLKKTWHEMSFRRIARMAAEEGYDAIAFTPGKLQAERYDLSKKVDSLEYTPLENGQYKIEIVDKDLVEVTLPNNGIIEKSDLPDLVGKEIADKILDGKGKKMLGVEKATEFRYSLTGLDLQVGGEGMKGFYDKMLKDYAAKWGKKFGAKVGVTKIQTGENTYNVFDESGVLDSNVTEGRVDEVIAEYNRIGGTNVGKVVQNDRSKQVWTLPVTKKMRDSVLSKGVATFGAAGVAAGVNNEARPNGN